MQRAKFKMAELVFDSSLHKGTTFKIFRVRTRSLTSVNNVVLMERKMAERLAVWPATLQLRRSSCAR